MFALENVRSKNVRLTISKGQNYFGKGKNQSINLEGTRFQKENHFLSDSSIQQTSWVEAGLYNRYESYTMDNTAATY